MQVSKAMTRNVRIANPDHSICDVARIMADANVGALPVGDKDRLVGMITDRDIAVRAVAQGLPPETKVREVMSHQVMYCFEDENLDHVTSNMGDIQVRRLPVLSRQKRLVGIVAIGDIAACEGGRKTGKAIAAISTPGGAHSQSSAAH